MARIDANLNRYDSEYRGSYGRLKDRAVNWWLTSDLGATLNWNVPTVTMWTQGEDAFKIRTVLHRERLCKAGDAHQQRVFLEALTFWIPMEGDDVPPYDTMYTNVQNQGNARTGINDTYIDMAWRAVAHHRLIPEDVIPNLQGDARDRNALYTNLLGIKFPPKEVLYVAWLRLLPFARRVSIIVVLYKIYKTYEQIRELSDAHMWDPEWNMSWWNQSRNKQWFRDLSLSDSYGVRRTFNMWQGERELRSVWYQYLYQVNAPWEPAYLANPDGPFNPTRHVRRT